jgi:methyltransferase (TIGR00027 family)
MKLIVYIVLMILLTPVMLLGLPFYFIPIVLKRGTVSGTAYEPFNARLIYHLLGSRPDPAAMQLAAGLPATNRFVMNLMVKPLAWCSQVTGYIPAVFKLPPPRPISMSAFVGARCEFLDAAMLDYVCPGCQVVILGAGWDTRAYGLLSDRDVTIFEVDAPATQAVKRSALESTGIDSSHVTFVACDFNGQSWLDALKENGFDCDKQTFVLWEGVTMYLEESAIQDTLKTVAKLPPGSRIACDFLGREWLEDTWAGKVTRGSVIATYGEPFTFGFPVQPDFSGALKDYLKPCGLSLERDLVMGDDSDGGLPFGGLFLAVSSSTETHTLD